VAAVFVASLMLMAVVTLLRELFSGRAMRAAPGSRIEPVTEVAMPYSGTAADSLGAGEPYGPGAGASSDAVRHESTGESRPPLDRSVDEEPGNVVAIAPEPVPYRSSPLGEVSVESAAEKLISGGAARAIFVSPEGDEAAAAAVLVAREVADAGLRVL